MLKLLISFASQTNNKIIIDLAPLGKSFLRVKRDFFSPTVLNESEMYVPLLNDLS